MTFQAFLDRLLGRSQETPKTEPTTSSDLPDWYDFTQPEIVTSAPVTPKADTTPPVSVSGTATTARSSVPKVKAPKKTAAKSTSKARSTQDVPVATAPSPGYEDDSFSTLTSIMAVEEMCSGFGSDSCSSSFDSGFSGGGGDFGGGGAGGSW